MIQLQSVPQLNRSASQQQAARWVGALFLTIVVLQRFAVPGLPLFGLLVPAVLIWTIAAVARRVVELDRTRLMCWLAAAGITATAMPIQARLVPGAQISITAWGLFMVVWLPFCVRLVERGTAVYLLTLRYVARIATALSALA